MGYDLLNKMPNKNYEKGRRKEYKICNELKDEGFEIVQRTAGSHSPVDIIAINKELGEIRLIQAKPDSMAEIAKTNLLEEHKWLNGWFEVTFEVL